MTRVVDPYPDDTINSLRAEVDRLRAALLSIKKHAMQRGHHIGDVHADYYRLSAKALEGDT
jgi:hypothetical protein